MDESNTGRIIAQRRGSNGEVLYLFFHNPEHLNALTIEMQKEFIETIRHAKNDKTVRVIVIRGSGDKSFCSGGSLNDLKALINDEGRNEFYERGVAIRELIESMDKPIISAVSGYCIGGGFEIAMCCDMIYASDNSKFALTEINLGLVPGWGGAIRLPRKVTVNKAKEMILLGEKVDAAEAYMLGIVNKVFPKEAIFEEVDKIVDKLLSKPPLAIRGIKSIVSHGIVDGNVNVAQGIEQRLSIYLMQTEDFQEAVDAFEEKRKPEFHGK